jgi:hypothetical protein
MKSNAIGNPNRLREPVSGNYKSLSKTFPDHIGHGWSRKYRQIVRSKSL